MEKKELIYEGKAKKVFATDNPDVLLVSYKDDATAFNGLKKGTISGKGAINNRVTNFMMRMLEKEDPEACRLLDFVYISGERKPAVRETMKKFHYGGVAVYYGRMKNAEKELTKNIFGYANNQAELTQILSYLRQMFDDEVSIDMVKHF